MLTTHRTKTLVGTGIVLAAALTVAACSDSSSEANGGEAGAAGAPSGSGGSEAGTGGSEAGAGGSDPGTGGTVSETDEVRSDVAYDTMPDVASDDYRSFIFNTNDFGLDVFAQLSGEDTNIVYSPVSVAVALGMTYAGARGDTAAQMATVMHNDLSDDAFHAANNQLAVNLTSRNIALHETEEGEKSLLLRLVNATWAQNGYAIEQPFLDVLATNYDAGVKLVDFVGDTEGARLAINAWAADQTEDRIQDLIGPNDLDADTRLVLTNALYFYGSWSEAFRVDSTSDGAFYTLSGGEVTAEMMHQSTSYRYGEGDGYQMLDIPYVGGELSMTIVLPEAGRFAEIRSLLSGDWLTQARASMADTQVDLTLPKWSFSWGTESLKESLQALGMTDAFTPLADFTGIDTSGLLYIFDVLQQAFIAVDESGTEAAAATAVIMGWTSDPGPGVPFIVDRPFLLFIRDSSGLILFTGQVTDPSL